MVIHYSGTMCCIAISSSLLHFFFGFLSFHSHSFSLSFFLGRHLYPKLSRKSFSFLSFAFFSKFASHLICANLHFLAQRHFFFFLCESTTTISFVFIYLRINVCRCEESLTLWEFLPHFCCLSIFISLHLSVRMCL
jgi:hypothetical protein